MASKHRTVGEQKETVAAISKSLLPKVQAVLKELRERLDSIRRLRRIEGTHPCHGTSPEESHLVYAVGSLVEVETRLRKVHDS